MFRSVLSRFGVLVALVALVSQLLPGVSLAATAGTGLDNALAPSGTWQHLKAGEVRWYTFNTAGATTNSPIPQVFVRMTSQPANSVGFQVWTRDLLNLSYSDSTVKPLGQGTQDSFIDTSGTTQTRYNGDLTWLGGFTAGGTFFVRVANNSMQDADYLLNISGQDNPSFSLPGLAEGPSRLPVTGAPAANAASSQAANSQSSQAATSSAASAGMSPSSAMKLSDQMMTLQPGESRWFKIDLGGDSSGAHPNMHAQLTSQPNGAPVQLSIWTPQRLNEFYNSGPNTTVQPVGRGEPQTFTDANGNKMDLSNGDLFWVGDARTGGTWYFQVQNPTNAPAQFKLMLNVY